MMTSTFGWIAIDARTVRQVRRELDADESGVVDEMGVGALHSGYANRYFPGTSVLQTRARYVFFVTWNFLAMRRAALPGARQRKLDYERVVTDRLIAHYGKVDGHGIIGVRVAPKPPSQPPDFIYWTALQKWQLCSEVARSTLLTRWDPKRIARRDEHRRRGDEDVGDELLAHFDVPPHPDRWPRDSDSLSFDLEQHEAEWLRERWARLDPPCLLSECGLLLRERGRRPRSEALWEDPLVLAAADRLDRRRHPAALLADHRQSLQNAHGSSALAELVRATYAAFVEAECERDLSAMGRKRDDAPRRYRDGLDAYFAAGDAAATLEIALRQDIDAVVRDLPEIASDRRRLDVLLRETQDAWRHARSSRTVLRNRALRSSYERSERRRKGSRARLAPTEGRDRRRGFEEATVSVDGLDYRWRVTRRLLLDVYEGLHGHART